MRIFSTIETYVGAEPVVLSIGNFDGLHRGHQYLLQKNLELASKKGARSVVLSFSPHSKQIFHPTTFCALSDYSDQERGFEQLGVDDWIIEPFTEQMRLEPPEVFLNRLLGHVPVCAIVVGPDFHFGKNRIGNVNLLGVVGASRGFEVLLPEPYFFGGQRVSSTQVRLMLSQGDVEAAADLLGRPYSIKGKVISGFHRGHQLGFPTANIVSSLARNLHRGVYKTLVYRAGRRWDGVTNVGFHPTFGEEPELKIETHILDFYENIYGEEIRIDFVRFLRGEMKFPSAEALVDQIKKDIQNARETRD